MAESAPQFADTTSPGWLRSTFDAFRVPDYRLLWLNSAFMLFAVNLAFTLQNVVAYDITGNNSTVGLVAFAQGFGMLISTPFAGVIADRVSKRLLLAAAELTLGIMAVSIAVLIVTDLISVVFLLVAGFMFGCSVSFFWPAQTALMGDIVEPKQRGNGAALFQVCLNLMRSIAPFVGSALLAVDAIGSGGAYFVVALLFVPVLFTAAMLPATVARDGVASAFWDEISLGARHVWENKRLFESMVSFVVVTLLGFSIMVILPGFTKDTLGAGDSGFGVMFGVNAIGALVASLIAASLSTSKHLPRLLTATGVAFGLTITLTGLMPNFATAVLAMLLVGAAGAGFQTLALARMLQVAAPEFFGRVMSLTNLAWSFTSLIGLLVGLAADFSSARTVLVGVGLLLAVVTLVLALWSKSDDLATPAPSITVVG